MSEKVIHRAPLQENNTLIVRVFLCGSSDTGDLRNRTKNVLKKIESIQAGRVTFIATDYLTMYGISSDDPQGDIEHPLSLEEHELVIGLVLDRIGKGTYDELKRVVQAIPPRPKLFAYFPDQPLKCPQDKPYLDHKQYVEYWDQANEKRQELYKVSDGICSFLEYQRNANLLDLENRIKDDLLAWTNVQLKVSSAVSDISGSELIQGKRRIKRPYKGLAPYSVEDANIFFGRSGEIRNFSKLISGIGKGNTQFLQIQGGSGVGKSSLVYAGILPEICSAGGDVHFVAMKPGGESPFVPLARALRGGEDEEGHEKYAVRIAEDFDFGCKALYQKLEDLLNNNCRVLVIDQLEEMLMPQLDGSVAYVEDKTQFIDFLKFYLADSQRNKIITTIREDRGDLLGREHWRPLVDLINEGRTPRLLAPDLETGLTEIVQEPAMRAGFSVEQDSLVDAIRQDVKDERYWPPLVSLALEQILLEFEEAELQSSDLPRHLTVDMYRKVGGIDGVISKITRNFMSKYVKTPSQRAALEELFTFLIRIDDSGNPAKARVRRSFFDNDTKLGPLISKMVNARLLADEGQVEIIHDRLFEAWPLLRDWVKERSEDIDELNDLLRQAKRWGRKKDKSLLLSNSRIDKAEQVLDRYGKWSITNPIVRKFVQSSRSEVDRQALINAIPKADFNELSRLLKKNKRLSKHDLSNPDFYYALYSEDLINHHDVKSGKPVKATILGGDETALKDAIEKYFTYERLIPVVAKGYRVSHYAALAGNRYLIEHINNLCSEILFKESEKGYKPIQVAAYGGQTEVVKWFLSKIKNDVDPATIVSKHGATLLYDATQSGNLETVKLVHKLAVPIDQPDDDGWSPLHIACSRGYSEIASYLTKQGANVFSILKNENGIATVAAVQGHCDTLHEVIKAAQLSDQEQQRLFNQRDAVGFDALTQILQNNNTKPDTIGALIELGANPNTKNKDGKAALHLTIAPYYRGSETYLRKVMVQVILDKGELSIKLDQTDDAGQTPLYYALDKDYLEIAELLIKAGASPFVKTPKDGTILQWLRDKKDGADALNIVVMNMTIQDVDPEIDGWTSLMYAAKVGNRLMVQELLGRQETDVNFVSTDGTSAATLMIKGNMVDLVSEMITGDRLDPWSKALPPRSLLSQAVSKLDDALIDQILKRFPCTPQPNTQGIIDASLAIACRMPAQVELVTRLLDLGAAPNTVDETTGATPLFRAALFGATIVFEKLVNAPQTKIDVVDYWGRNPSEYAPDARKDEFTALLNSALTKRQK